MGDDRPLDAAELVVEHHEVLYGYAYRLTGSVQDAEDLTQQTFLVAQAKLDQLRDGNAARAWLFTILRNCFRKSLRRRQATPACELELSIENIPDNAHEETDIDQERLQAALDGLPDDFKLVLMLFYFERCSYREIAERLDLPIGTVMSRLSRAKSHLRAKLFEPEFQGTARSQGLDK